ncbi:2-hydroxy-3-oxopropionate reductase [Lasiodiplodia theobromae]|uniref:2-hydroxy-3-oxopropionate reductase n=1 Tax=Lasiodiplodia theobromae TaxID=45133 RepID=UPI0015C3F628|nr:2-hydroxy-3-oxopropionate reductase [Lasiodiplodia theobromae]KAF4539412.1 2-hydroxy-3-oxopropionate reductase [Lasiodiplodia theobromae]
MRVGFLGLGVMGVPMALNLSRKFPLTVWNRSSSKYPLLTQAGAKIGETPSNVVECSEIIFSMLFDGAAIKAILDDDFKRAMRGKILVNSSSVTVECSQYLAEQINQAGGQFIEMPVSGSKVPAEQGQLVGMLAGDPEVAERVKPIVEPMTKAAIFCGPIGSGLKTKYSTNLFLISMTAGLAEAMSLAQAQGLNLETFGQVLDAGPMSSAYSRLKIAKIIHQDWSAQAAIKDCYNSTRLIHSAAQEAGIRSPMIQLCESLYKEANESGLSEEDMIAVHKLTQLAKR